VAKDLKLGLQLGYWGAGPPPGAAETVGAAERLGFDSMWTAEAYGSDAFTPLSWWGASTHRIKLGTAIAQMSARAPTATAMAALTLDHLSGGRVILGLGVSGPQVVEGWYGDRFGKPLGKTREYIEIVRKVWRREGPVTHVGEHYRLPIEGGTGLGKPLKSIVHPLRPEIPIYLGAEGPKNVALAAELCDGWLTFFFSPWAEDLYKERLGAGFAVPGARRGWDDFEIAASVPLIVHDDVEIAADLIRPMFALYFGGMGHKTKNFHAEVAIRMGYEDVVDKVQDLYLDGKKDEAAAAIPIDLVEKLALIGPADKIRHDLGAWRDSIATTLLVGGDAGMIRQAAELVLG
jgi:F420-dependent oxidoreductase-like protein